MKTTKDSFLKIRMLALGILSVFAVSCSSNDKQPQTQEEKDYRFARIYIDEGINEMVNKAVMDFDSIDAEAKLTVASASAWDCMAKLLTGEAEALITPKDYTRYEDSVMKAFDVKPHVKMSFAFDALVFYVGYNQPIDSLTDAQIKSLLTNSDKKFSDFFPRLGKEFEFVTNSHLSSEIVNLKNLVLGTQTEKRKIKYLGNQKQVVDYVKNNNAIGIGYLSQINKDPDLKALRISFNDSTGKYIFPHAVHQANIVRKLYPYIVTHYIYVFSEQKEAAMRLGRYLSKNAQAQRYFLGYGIAPAFAKIKLIDEE